MTQRIYREFQPTARTRLFASPAPPVDLATAVQASSTIDANLSTNGSSAALEVLFSANTDIQADLTAPTNLAANLLCSASMEATVFSHNVENRPPIVQPVALEIVFVEGVAGTYQIVATDPDLDPMVYDKNEIPLPPGVTFNETLGRYEYDGSLWGLTEDVITNGHIVYADDQRSDPQLPPKRVFAEYRLVDARRIYQHVITNPLSAFFQCGADLDVAISSEIPLQVDVGGSSELVADLFDPGAILAGIESSASIEADLFTDILLQADVQCGSEMVAQLTASEPPLEGKGVARATVRQGGARASVRVGSVRARVR